MKDTAKHHMPSAVAEEFVSQQRHGTLSAVGDDGFPKTTILPYLKDGDTIELHCVRADLTFAALRINPRVSFLVLDFLAYYPHEWVDPSDGGRASLAYRAVNFECEATYDEDPVEVAGALTRLVRAYSPEANYAPFADDDFFGSRLRQLAVVRLSILRSQIKFKVGPAGIQEGARRANLAKELRDRGGLGDEKAAYWIDLYNKMRLPDGSWS